MQQLGSHCHIFMKFAFWLLFENMSRKFNFHENLTRITGTLHEDPCSLMIISRSFLLRMRNVSDKICSMTFLNKNPSVCKILWKNIFEPGMLQMTTWRMLITCSIPKATNRYLEYVILIAFPLQQWLHDRTSICTLRVLFHRNLWRHVLRSVILK